MRQNKHFVPLYKTHVSLYFVLVYGFSSPMTSNKRPTAKTRSTGQVQETSNNKAYCQVPSVTLCLYSVWWFTLLNAYSCLK